MVQKIEMLLKPGTEPNRRRLFQWPNHPGPYPIELFHITCIQSHVVILDKHHITCIKNIVGIRLQLNALLTALLGGGE